MECIKAKEIGAARKTLKQKVKKTKIFALNNLDFS